jgi:hypothetical protein
MIRGWLGHKIKRQVLIEGEVHRADPGLLAINGCQAHIEIALQDFLQCGQVPG